MRTIHALKNPHLICNECHGFGDVPVEVSDWWMRLVMWWRRQPTQYMCNACEGSGVKSTGLMTGDFTDVRRATLSEGQR